MVLSIARQDCGIGGSKDELEIGALTILSFVTPLHGFHTYLARPSKGKYVAFWKSRLECPLLETACIIAIVAPYAATLDLYARFNDTLHLPTTATSLRLPR